MAKVPTRNPAQRVQYGDLPVKDLDAAARGFTAFGAALQKTLGSTLEAYADSVAKTKINSAKNEFSLEVPDLVRQAITDAEANGEDLDGEAFKTRVTTQIEQAQQKHLDKLGVLAYHPDTAAAARGVLADIATAGAADAAKIAFQKKLSNSRNEFDLDAEASSSQFVRDADPANKQGILSSLDTAKAYYGDQARAQVAGGMRSNEDASRWAKQWTQRTGEGAFIRALDADAELAKSLVLDPDNPFGFDGLQRQKALQQANLAIDRQFAERQREATNHWIAAVQAADTPSELEALTQQATRDKNLSSDSVLRMWPVINQKIDAVTTREAYKSNAEAAIAGLSTVDFANREEVAVLNSVIMEREGKIIEKAEDTQSAVQAIMQDRVETTANLGQMPTIYQRQLRPNPAGNAGVQVQNAEFLSRVEERNPFALEGMDEQTLTYYSVVQDEVEAGRSPVEAVKIAARVVAPDVSGEREAYKQMFNEERQGVWVSNRDKILKSVFGTTDVPGGAELRVKREMEKFYSLSLGDYDVALRQTAQRLRGSSTGWGKFGEDWTPNAPSMRPEFQNRALPEGWENEQFNEDMKGLNLNGEDFRIQFLDDPGDGQGPGYLVQHKDTGTQLPNIWRPDAQDSPAYKRLEGEAKTRAALEESGANVVGQALGIGSRKLDSLIGIDRNGARKTRFEAAQEENKRLREALSPDKLLRIEGALKKAAETSGIEEEPVPFDPNDPRVQRAIEEATQ